MVVILDKKLKKEINKEICRQMKIYWKDFWENSNTINDFKKFMRK